MHIHAGLQGNAEHGGEIQLDCSVFNTLMIGYLKNLSIRGYPLKDVQKRNLVEIRLECNNQVHDIVSLYYATS